MLCLDQDLSFDCYFSLLHVDCYYFEVGDHQVPSAFHHLYHCLDHRNLDLVHDLYHHSLFVIVLIYF